VSQLHARLDALERSVHTPTQHTHTATRRLRWWRSVACGLAVASLLGWGLPLSLAREDAHEKDKDQKGLVQRVAARAASLGATLTPAVGDRVLDPGETVAADFVIGLQARARFTFLVDLFGEPVVERAAVRKRVGARAP
jgi:hypothetical protein